MSLNYFDINAANWDIPMRVERAQTIAHALLREVAPAKNTIVADYGSGTGLLAVALAPHVGEVIALDNSAAMLAVLQNKCRTSAIPNIHGRLFDIEQDEIETGICDLFVSSMVLHHLRSPEQYARAARQALRPGGLAVVIDLDSEGGEFHEDHTGVHHHGFDRDTLGKQFRAAGFDSVRFSTVFTIRKAGRSGLEQDFSLFMLIASTQATETNGQDERSILAANG